MTSIIKSASDKKIKSLSLTETLQHLIEKYKIQKGDHFLFESMNEEGAEKLNLCQMLSSKTKLSITDDTLLDSDAIEVLSSIEVSKDQFKKMFDLFGVRNPNILGDEDTALKGSIIYNKKNNDVTRVYKLTQSQYQLANETFSRLEQDKKLTSDNKISIKSPSKNI
jgi:hypothetical protein